MKKEDLENLKQHLKEMEAEVAKLKEQDPDGDFTEIDETLEKFREMVDDPKLTNLKRMFKRKSNY